MELAKELRNYIEENLQIFDDDVSFSDSDNIFEMGFVNSQFAIQLVLFIENNCGIKIENDELDVTNFSSIDKMVTFIENKKSA